VPHFSLLKPQALKTGGQGERTSLMPSKWGSGGAGERIAGDMWKGLVFATFISLDSITVMKGLPQFPVVPLVYH
jgi:hypothetical protein